MTGDPVLAEMMARVKPSPPVEEIEHTNWLATALSLEAGHLKNYQRVVKLACGHTAITKARHRCACQECHRMIMAGEDYVGFRFGSADR